MVFDTSSPPVNSSSTDRVLSLDHMFNSPNSTSIELPLSDERDLSQIEGVNRQQPSKWKMVSKRRQSCTNDRHLLTSRHHRLKSTTTANHLLSSSDETLSSSSKSTCFSTHDKFHNKSLSNNIKYFPTQSSLIKARRSTTDCNNLIDIHRRPLEQTNNTLLTMVDEETTDPIWLTTGKRNISTLSLLTFRSKFISHCMYYRCLILIVFILFKSSMLE